MKQRNAIIRLVLGVAVLALSSASSLHEFSHPFDDLAHSAHKHQANSHCLHLSSEHVCSFCASGPSVTTIETSFEFISTTPLGYHIILEAAAPLHSFKHTLPSLRGPPVAV